MQINCSPKRRRPAFLVLNYTTFSSIFQVFFHIKLQKLKINYKIWHIVFFWKNDVISCFFNGLTIDFLLHLSIFVDDEITSARILKFHFAFCQTRTKKRKETNQQRSSLKVGCGSDLFSRAVTSQVSSACQSLTSVFGMGTGGTSEL